MPTSPGSCPGGPLNRVASLLVLHQARLAALILLDVEQLGAVEAVLLRVLDFDDAHGNGVCLPQHAALCRSVALAL